MTKLGVLCDRLLEAGWLLALATVPLYFDIYSSRVFEPDKITILRCLVLAMALAQLVKWFEGRPARAPVTTDQTATVAEGASAASALVAGDSPRLWWRWWPANPLALPTVIVVATYLLGTAVSVAPAVSFWGSYQRLQGTYSMLAYIALFFLMAGNLRRRPQIERLFNVVLLVSLPISFYGVVQHLHRDPLPWGGDVTARVTSTLGNAIFLAAYLIMVVPITLHRLLGVIARLRGARSVPRGDRFAGLPRVIWLAGILIIAMAIFSLFTMLGANQPNLWWAALPLIGAFTALSLLFSLPRPSYITLLAEAAGYVLLLGLQLTAIFLSGSRGPWIGLMVGLICFVMLLAVRHHAQRLLAAAAAAAAVAVVFLAVFNLPSSPLAPLRQVPYVGRLGILFDTKVGTVAVRTLIWQGTFDLLGTRPPVGLSDADPLALARLLVGYGPESMYVVYNKVYPPDLAHYEQRNASPDRNHNDALDNVVTVGFIGLLAYALLVVSALYLIWQHLWRAPSLSVQLPLVAMLAALIAHLVESQTGIVIAATRTYFWAYLAVAVVAGLVYQRQQQSASVSPQAGTAEYPTPMLASSEARIQRPKRRRAGRQGPALWVGEDSDGSALGTPRELPSVAGRLLPLAFMLLVLLSIAILARMDPLPDLRLALLLSFVGLVAAGVTIAFALGHWPAAPVWQSRNWWIYALAAIAMALVVSANLDVVSADMYFKRGFGYDSARQYDLSVPNYQQAIRLAGGGSALDVAEPATDYYLLFLGRAYLELAKATQRPKIPGFSPTLETALDLSGKRLAALGREDLMNVSELVLLRARALSPLNTDHYANLARLYRTWSQMGDRAKLDLADAYFRQATTLSPHAAQLSVEWAQVYLDMGKLDDALAQARRAAALDGRYSPAFTTMGDSYLATGQPAEALTAHRQALALDPLSLSDARFEQRIADYAKAGALPQVEAMYAAATQRRPDSTALHSAYGFVLVRANKPREAIAEFQTNVRLAPTDWAAHRALALVYEALGMHDQALASAQTAQRYAPPDQAGALQGLVGDIQKRRP